MAQDANLSSLSPSVLERCLSFCEDEDLLRLSHTSKQFNETALGYLFFCNRSEKWLFGPTMISFNHLQEWCPCLTAALRSALFIQSLTWLDYYFLPDAKRLVDDVRHLKYLFQRLVPGSTIHLCFSRVDDWVIKGGPLLSLSLDGWLADFRDLLSIALRQGCSRIWVESGGFFMDYLRKVTPSSLHSSTDVVDISQSIGTQTYS